MGSTDQDGGIAEGQSSLAELTGASVLPPAADEFADEGTAAMDIHKPKPVHSIREFLNEILVIITGVLIALGLEQAVESWDHAEQVAQARETLREELAVNLASLRHTQRNTPCLVANYNHLIALIDSGDVAKVQRIGFASNPGGIAREPKGGAKSISGALSLLALRVRAWETANASGLLAYMSPQETLTFATAYSRVDTEKRYRTLFGDKSIETFARSEIFDGSKEEARALKLLIIEQQGYWASRRDAAFKELTDVIGDIKLEEDPSRALRDCKPIDG